MTASPYHKSDNSVPYAPSFDIDDCAGQCRAIPIWLKDKLPWVTIDQALPWFPKRG